MLVSVLCGRIVVMVFDKMIEDEMERRKGRLVAHGLRRGGEGLECPFAPSSF